MPPGPSDHSRGYHSWDDHCWGAENGDAPTDIPPSLTVTVEGAAT